MVRAFHDDDILRHGDAAIDPAADIDIINTELILADIQTIDKHIPKLSKEAKSDPAKRAEMEYLLEMRQTLNTGAIPKSKIQNPKSTLQLLSSKPTIYAFNVDETGLTDSKLQSQLKSLVSPSDCVFVCAKLEEELRGLDEADAAELLASYGVHNLPVPPTIHLACKAI